MSEGIRTISGQDLKAMLEELYLWYFKQAREANKRKKHTNDNAWKLGKMDGGVETVGAIYLALYGGKEMYALWQGALADCGAEDQVRNARKDGQEND